MKIKGRFIAVLAAVGLLVALLPALPTGAVEGTITLKGQVDDKPVTHYSDNKGFNVVTIEVKDVDLSPVRSATARYVDGGTNTTTLHLKRAALEGEIGKTFDFDGGLINPVCDLDRYAGNDDVRIEAAVTEDGIQDSDRFGSLRVFNPDSDGDNVEGSPGDATEIDHDDADTYTVEMQAEVADGCEKMGDVLATGTAGAALTANDIDAEDVVEWHITLAADKVVRDLDKDGRIDEADVTVEVDGETVDPLEGQEAPTGFTLGLEGDANGSPPTNNVPLAADPSYGGTSIVLRADPGDDNDVEVTYKYSEYAFDAATPIGEDNLSVHYDPADADTSFKGATTLKRGIDAVSSASANITFGNQIADANHVIVRFEYDVKETIEDNVAVSSDASEADQITLELDGVETGAATGVFMTTVGLFHADDYARITDAFDELEDDANAISDLTEQLTADREAAEAEALKADDDEQKDVDDLEADDDADEADIEAAKVALAAATKAAKADAAAMVKLFDDLMARLDDVRQQLHLDTGDDAEDLVGLLLPVRHGNAITVRYSDDGSSTRNKSATADLEGPVVTLDAPTEKYLSEGLATLSATVVDMDSGVGDEDDDAKLTPITTAELGDVVRTPVVVDRAIVGYTLSAAAAEELEEGEHKWYIEAKDKVGNSPDPDEKGSTAAKAFSFFIDSVGPELIKTGVAGKTGLTLKNPGVTEGDNKETEKKDAQWLRLNLNLGDGGAPVDPATVQAADFRVDGAEPLEALVNSVDHTDADKGSAVYLKVGDIESDARPTVVLSGEIADLAGNPRTSGTATSLDDGIAPSLTVTPSSDLDDSEIVITVTSSEALQSAPSIRLTEDHPKGKLPAAVTPVSVSRTVGTSQPTWTHTYKVSDGDASLLYVVVEATDRRSNTAYKGRGNAKDLKDKKDLVTFQADDAEPMLRFVDPSGELLEEEDQEEGAVWIIAEFDEDEYTGDTYRKITLTAVSLTDSDDNVITDNVDDLFSGGDKVPCDDHGGATVTTHEGTEDEETNPLANKCATHTLAINLAPGDYNIEITGVDAVGNEVSEDVDFTVIEKEPFELTLSPGVNLVSIPGDAVGDSGNLNILFEDEPVTIVTTYDRNLDVAGQNPWLRSTKDPETGLFTGDIVSLQPGVAYFVTAGARTTVEITIQTLAGALPPTLQVRYGFNAIGYWSISGAESEDMDSYLSGITWSVAYSYDPTPRTGLSGWEIFRPQGEGDAEEGKGYLVFVSFDSTLTP